MATLVYSDVDGTDRSFSLGAEPILVGRSAECAIRSDDPRVSRQHARFYLEHGALDFLRPYVDAVRAAEILDPQRVVLEIEPRVLVRHPRVVAADCALGRAADEDGFGAQRE